MAISFVAAGVKATDSGSGGNVTPALPAGIAAGDILICLVASADNVAHSLPAAYTNKVNTTSGTILRFSVWWARATGSDSAPLVTHTAGNAIIAQVIAYRGAASSGDPFSAAASQANSGATATITAPTITPVSGDMVVFAAGWADINTNNNPETGSGWSGTNPSFTERTDSAGTPLGTDDTWIGTADGTSTGVATGARTTALVVAGSASSGSVGALLALTQDSGAASSFPSSTILPLSGIGLPGQPPIAPPAAAPGSDRNAFDVVSTQPIAQFVHPLNLVLGPRLFPAPQPYIPAVTSVSYTDSASGTITLSGTSTESQVDTGSPTGTITLSGTASQSFSHSSSGSGTITLSGTATGSHVYSDSRSGTITLSGSATQSWTTAASATGTITISGTGFDNYVPPSGGVSRVNTTDDPNLVQHLFAGVR